MLSHNVKQKLGLFSPIGLSATGAILQGKYKQKRAKYSTLLLLGFLLFGEKRENVKRLAFHRAAQFTPRPGMCEEALSLKPDRRHWGVVIVYICASLYLFCIKGSYLGGRKTHLSPMVFFDSSCFTLK